MTYIDGFILPIRDDVLAEYTPMAEMFSTKAKALGAIGSLEAIGDGLEHGHTTDFFKAVKAEEGENVIFSFVIWPDKETRDKGWAAIMADPEMQPDKMPNVFDGKRMFWGGFKPIVNSIELAGEKVDA